MMPHKEKRETVLYTRVKKQNKIFIDMIAEVNGVSVSEYIDYFIDQQRQKYVSKQK